MKRYLAWNRSEQVCPAIASSPPPSAFAAVPFSLNGITSCPSSATAANTTNLFTTSTDTTTSNLFSAAFAAAATVPSESSYKINSANIFLDQNKTLLGPPDNTSLAPNSPQVTTSAFNRHQPQLSAAAAEYLLAAAFASNTSQIACPSTSYPQPLTPIQQPQTPQQQLDSFLVQYNHEQNLQRQQNAATTAALVAALQQRQQQQHQLHNHDIQPKSVTDNNNSDQRFVNSNGNVDLFANAAAAAAAVQTSNIDQNNAASIVAQFSSSSIPCGNVVDGGPLANNLANVCAAAAAAAAVTVTAQPPPSIDNVGPSSVLSTTSTSIVQPNGKSSSTPIILNSLTSNSSLGCGSSTIDSTNNTTSNNNNNINNLSSSTRSAFLSPQHSSAFQLVSPLSQQNQNSSNISGINFLQQHHLQNQNLSSLNNPQEALHSTTSAAAVATAAAIQQQQALTLASTLSASLPLPPAPSSSSTLSSSTSSLSSQQQQPQHRQQAVPAGLSQHTQSQTTNEIHPSPMNQAAAAAAAALYPQLMCLPALLDHLGPHILRSHMNSTQLKPIPNNEKVDLARFRVKEPQEWVMDDVLAWMLDVARRNQVPVENINMHKFATCNGPRLLLMNEQAFLERDPVYGTMLFKEFRKLVGEDNVIDDWMRSYKEAEEDSRPSTSRGLSFDIKPPSSQSSSSSHSQTHVQHQQHQQQQQQQQHHFNGFLGVHSPISPLIQNSLSQQHAAAAAAAVAAAASQQFLKPPTAPLNNLHRTPPQLSAAQIVAAAQNSLSNGNTSYDSRGDQSFHGVNSLRIKKNKDGRPRKRSQHTKGNKLWEFIRDALKDPCTCPSIVRWEDPVEGVFRIVESEKLARLWGEKKNNQKMTYEKLSRAMRTYYEKQILVPVPKTGLYPKKLVYKFGPGANGVSAPPQMIAASNAAMRMEPMDTA